MSLPCSVPFELYRTPCERGWSPDFVVETWGLHGVTAKKCRMRSGNSQVQFSSRPLRVYWVCPWQFLQEGRAKFSSCGMNDRSEITRLLRAQFVPFKALENENNTPKYAFCCLPFLISPFMVRDTGRVRREGNGQVSQWEHWQVFLPLSTFSRGDGIDGLTLSM